jgi:hypothetical protein
MCTTTANEYLWGQDLLRERIMLDVLARSAVDADTRCRVSTYAVGEAGVTPYPVVKRACPDGRSRRFYAHHVVMMTKAKARGSTEMWDTTLYQVSHECHNPKCVNADHLELLRAEENRAKNIHCVGHVTCTACGVRMRVCQHPTLCLTEVSSTCSVCERGVRVPV